jgi:glycyl-tRNA synthetase alpha chain
VEITYGIERIAMYLQDVENVYDLTWVGDVTYGDVFHRNEWEFSTHNFEVADTELHLTLFDRFEKECLRLCDELETPLPLPAYDYCLKCSHVFNVLDARGAISVAERQKYIFRVRTLARRCAEEFLASREQLGFPLMKRTWGQK